MGAIVLSAVISAIVAVALTMLLVRPRPQVVRRVPLPVGPRIVQPPMPRVTRTRPMWGRPAPREAVQVAPIVEAEDNFEVETRLLIRV